VTILVPGQKYANFEHENIFFIVIKETNLSPRQKFLTRNNLCSCSNSHISGRWQGLSLFVQNRGEGSPQGQKSKKFSIFDPGVTPLIHNSSKLSVGGFLEHPVTCGSLLSTKLLLPSNELKSAYSIHRNFSACMNL
jgi:hypothetical protein